MAASALSLVAPAEVPAVGMATQFGMPAKSWGLEGAPRRAHAVALTNIWSQLAKYGFPVIALAGLAAEGGSNRSLELVALIGLIIFVVIVAGFGGRALEQAVGPGRGVIGPPVRRAGANVY